MDGTNWILENLPSSYVDELTAYLDRDGVAYVVQIRCNLHILPQSDVMRVRWKGEPKAIVIDESRTCDVM